MMRLVMEAVMIIAIVSGLVFMMKVNAAENQADSPTDTDKPNDNEQGKQ